MRFSHGRTRTGRFFARATCPDKSSARCAQLALQLQRTRQPRRGDAGATIDVRRTQPAPQADGFSPVRSTGEKNSCCLCRSFVLQNKEHAPPIHSLPRLARMAGISLSPERREQLVLITSFNIEARYPDLKRSFRNKCTREFAAEQVNGIQDVMKWLREIMTLKK